MNDLKSKETSQWVDNIRIPLGDTSSYRALEGFDGEALTSMTDIVPTGFLNGKVKPGDTIAIVGAGPIGLATLVTAQRYSLAEIIMIDFDDSRLAISRKFGATRTINSSDGRAIENLMELTKGKGVDVAIQADRFQPPAISARRSETSESTGSRSPPASRVLDIRYHAEQAPGRC